MLVGHQSSRESEHREELIVKDACCSTLSVVVGDVCLGIACEVVFDDQDVLDNRFLFHAHGYLHRDIVNVDHGTSDSYGCSSSSSGPCPATRIFP